jgi:hypothetical protein
MANGVAEIIEAPAPSRAIRGVDKFITFFPDEPSVSIIPGDADAPFGENASPIHAYLTVEGKKVETKIAELARTGYFPTESDATVDGVDCKLLDWRFPKEKIELKLWIATSQGSLIKRYQEFYNQQLMHEVNVSLALFGGAFALSAVEDSSWQEGKLQKRTSYMVQSLDLKAKVDAITLSPADLGIPSGCIVQDRLAGTEYRYKP